MKHASRISATLLTLALVVGLAPWGIAQNTYQPNAGKYGVKAWAIQNQRNASAFNYYIDSIWGTGLGAYSFPASTIYQAVPKGSQGFAGGTGGGPFNTNASVKVIDVNSANTETVTFSSNSCTTGAGVSAVCTLSLATANSHGSYILRSGSCGLREALNDLGANGGEVIVDQQFYDDGCTQSTITGINALVATASGGSNTGPIYPNQYVHDISNGQDLWYKVGATSVSLQAAPSTPTAPTASAATGTFTTGSTYTFSAAYVDPIGEITAGSTGVAATGSNGYVLLSPAAQTGAVGWIPYVTAAGGADTTEIMVTPTAAVCGGSLSALTIIPACPIGNSATILAVPSGTSFEVATNATASNGFGTATARTAFGLLPTATNPNFTSSVGAWAENNIAFTGRTETSAKTYDEAMVWIPPNTLNFLGSKWRVCWQADGTGNTVPVPSFLLQSTNNLEQSPNTLATFTDVAITAVSWNFRSCANLVIAATGSSGTAYVDGVMTSTITSTGAPGTAQTTQDLNTTAKTVGDLTKGIWLTLQSDPTVSTGITTLTVRKFSVEAIP